MTYDPPDFATLHRDRADHSTWFTGYIDEGCPIVLHAQRARDLRPFLRRADQFRFRGYWLEVVP